MTNEDTDVVVRFTRDEALVPFEWVHRAADEDARRSASKVEYGNPISQKMDRHAV